MVSRSWQAKNANASNALPTASGGAVALAGGDATAGQALFRPKCSACHAVGAVRQTLVGPGLKGVLHDPAHPNLVDGDPATPAERREDPAERLQRQHGRDAERDDERALGDKDIANLVAYLDSLK